MAKRKALEAEYRVGSGDVRLRVIIGDGQLGSSIVKLAGQELGSGQIATLAIGSGPQIAGKTLSVITTVTDVQRSTNQTSVTYVLEGGPKTQEFVLQETVDAEGGVVIYKPQFRLIA